MSGATVAIRLASRLVSSLVPAGRGARRRGPGEVDIALDRSSHERPRVDPGAAGVGPRGDPRPIRAPAAHLRDRDRRVRARTNATSGSSSRSRPPSAARCSSPTRFLTRYIARPILLGGGQLVFGSGCWSAGCADDRPAARSDQRLARRGESAASGGQRAPVGHVPAGASRLRDQHPHRRRQHRHDPRAVRRRRAAGHDRLAGDARACSGSRPRHRCRSSAAGSRGRADYRRAGSRVGIGSRAGRGGARAAATCA